jgi:VWFA-related protein
MTGLRGEDFQVFEDGVQRTIVSFESIVVKGRQEPGVAPRALPRTSAPEVAAPEEGRQLLIFFDDVHVTSASSERVRRQLVPYLARELHEGDWVTIVTPERGTWWTARSLPEYDLLPEVIGRLSGQLNRNPFHDSLTEWEAMRIVEGEQALPPRDITPGPRGVPQPGAPVQAYPAEKYAVAQRRIRQTLRALERAIDALVGSRGHKTLLLVSEGFILSPSMSREYERVIDAARRAQVAVHFIAADGLASGLPQAGDASGPAPSQSPGIMREGQVGGSALLSAATGGREFVGNDIGAGISEALAEASAYYLLGFEPQSTRGGAHRVRIRVMREGAIVRSKDRYFYRRLGPERSATERALLAVGDETALPIRMRALLGESTAKGEVDATLLLEIASPDKEGSRRALKVWLEARRADGRSISQVAHVRQNDMRARAFALRGLHLTPGTWQVRAVVEDKGTRELGSVLHTVSVPESGGLRVSIRTISGAPLTNGSPGFVVAKEPSRDRMAYCTYRVWGARVDPTTNTQRVTVDHSIRQGELVVLRGVASVPDRAQDGSLLGIAEVPLASLAPGVYVWSVRVRDEVAGEARDTEESFTVLPEMR